MYPIANWRERAPSLSVEKDLRPHGKTTHRSQVFARTIVRPPFRLINSFSLMFLCLSDRWAPKEIRRRQASAIESRLVTGDRILQPARGHGDARPWKNGSFRKGLSEIVIRVCVGPAGCHLEPSMFIGWQRINPTRESINMSAILH